MIRAAGIEEQDAPRKFVRVKKNVSIHVGDKWASLEPYDGYKLSFAIDFGHPAIDETAQFVEVDFNKENYIESVSHARTFGFVNDLEMLWGMGLAQGGTLDNAIAVSYTHLASPVIAEVAQELGILTVAVVTKPFSFEGGKRMRNAELGLNQLKNRVHSLIVILNDKLEEELGEDATMRECFEKADEVLFNACAGIAELIQKVGQINLDLSLIHISCFVRKKSI